MTAIKNIYSLQEIQKYIIDICKKYTYSEIIDIDENLFEIGLNSISCIQIMHEIELNFNVKLPLNIILKHSSVRKLSLYLYKDLEGRI